MGDRGWGIGRAVAYYNLGRALTESNELIRAVEAYEKAIEIAESDLEAEGGLPGHCPRRV